MKKSLLIRRPALNGRGEDGIEFIYAQIKITLFNFYYLIRADLKKRWKTMPHTYRRESITALRFLEDAFKNPAKYFSRAETDCAWRTRATNYANNHGLKNIVDAFYIIESPKDIFMKSVKDAILSHDIYSDLYAFVTTVQHWEYDRTSKQEQYLSQSKYCAETIIKTAQKMQKIVNIQDSNPLVRPFKEFAYGFQR